MEVEIYHSSYMIQRELYNLTMVSISVVVSLCYCYFSAKFIPKGMTRLFSIIPILCLFTALPLNFHSVSLCSTIGFIIGWLSNFKLLLFSFGKGPLSDPSLSLPYFIAIACFPVRFQQNAPSDQTKSQKSQNKNHPYPLDQDSHKSQDPTPNSPRITQKGHTASIWNYAIKGVLAALFLHSHNYREQIHPKVILIIYGFLMYFIMEIDSAMAAAAARVLLGMELEPVFDNPFLSTSLQDFWGRRWNLVVSRTLHQAIYEPVICFSARFIGRKLAQLPAVMCTFLVSALLHQQMFYYMGRMRPTWEVTCFFLLHGACLLVEMWIKKVAKGRFWLPRLISTPMTVGFIMVTGYWLFIPQFLKCKIYDRSFKECEVFGAFVKEVVAGLLVY